MADDYDPENPNHVMGLTPKGRGTGALSNMNSGVDSPVTGPQFSIDDAGPMTVRFGIVLAQNASEAIAAEAVILSSVGGNQIRRKVSVGNGVAITVFAEQVSVTLVDVSGQLSGARPTGQRYGIFTQVSRGLRAGFLFSPALYDTAGPYAVGFGVGGTVDVAVPQNAGVQSVKLDVVSVAAPITPNTVVAHAFGQSLLNPLKSWDPTTQGFVQLPPGTTVVEVDNTAGSAGVTATYTWGIEG